MSDGNIRYNYAIQKLALDISNTGAHYLWGAAGATPGGREGMIRRRESVHFEPNSKDPNYPMIFAASCKVSGKYICHGRFANVPGGRPANSGDQDLIDYLNNLDPNDPSVWSAYYGFTPRTNTHGRILWGEDCRGIQHFDCVGFINYCVENGLQITEEVRAIQFSINAWGDNGMGATYGVDKDSEPYPADILIRGDHHIGFLGVDDNGNAMVIEAAESDKGIITTQGYDSNNWTQRRRLSDLILSRGHIEM